jgi:hypothetical protein
VKVPDQVFSPLTPGSVFAYGGDSLYSKTDIGRRAGVAPFFSPKPKESDVGTNHPFKAGISLTCKKQKKTKN